MEDDIRRVVGALQADPEKPDALIAHSFLMFEEKYDIDNAFYQKLEHISPEEVIVMNQKQRQLDIAPNAEQSKSWFGTSVEDIDGDKLRLVLGPDDKMEQKLAFDSSCVLYARELLYDINMRKFIKEKYGVEIVSLAEKWSKLCWNCSAVLESSKLCSDCKIACYCGKPCQKSDWKVHRELHKAKKEMIKWEMMGVF